MIDAKIIRQVLDKFLKAETVKHARMQVMTLDGVFHDIKAVKLLENRILGARESHRIVIEVFQNMHLWVKSLRIMVELYCNEWTESHIII